MQRRTNAGGRSRSSLVVITTSRWLNSSSCGLLVRFTVAFVSWTKKVVALRGSSRPFGTSGSALSIS